uniref:SAC3/GANP/THP3 conserved domain-containing protein n=1 Tax=Caenorhabditis japonica TaxID=281687 RepID=A0A8R1HZ38_CAEJA
MCTEKERYQRIVQKGVSPFECDIATGDAAHEMMVKQYARSAADQERPLPHELRSEKIMNHAMCYLLHNILDEFPESADQRAAWYNFLWSRTRALRKEVTQLSMSDLLALNLVERCTRLHILFGYVLCDLETEHFDTAMNNETLGKCLQTLRHLYEDFAKRGIPCENEPEFRAYDVMLHMNDTNVLSQVLSYRSDVRQSQPICLALKLAGAFRDKNYCRFFRLLKNEATFLQCCVSHKLFGATRSNAISIMVNSYGRNAFPLEKLRNILAFDLIEEVTETLNIYGLRTESESDHVMLTKDGLTLNESVPMKPYQWIDQKKTGKLSQVVYGPNLFQFFASRCDVSNSFNHRNEYTNDKVLEAVLDGSNIPVSSDPSAFSFAQSAGSLSMQATMEQKRKMEVERIKAGTSGKNAHLINSFCNRFYTESTLRFG